MSTNITTDLMKKIQAGVASGFGRDVIAIPDGDGLMLVRAGSPEVSSHNTPGNVLEEVTVGEEKYLVCLR